MFYALFDISGTIEASALNFSHTMHSANRLLSHSWLAPIATKGGGSKNGVNFGIFKNHCGGLRSGQISTYRSQIYTHGGGWLASYFFPNYTLSQ